MRILVTGVSGQVGAALVPRLVNNDVIAADRSIIDLAQPNGIGPALNKLDPAVIINAAAYTMVDQAESERDLANLVNAVAPEMMAQWAAARGVPLIHFSTDYVFDGSGEKSKREDDETGPLSVYGKTKLDGERAIRVAGGPSLVVRTSWVYSATGKNFLRTIARLAREREQLRIVADQIGAPTSATLIADTLIQMLGGDLEQFKILCIKSGGLVHLAAAGYVSWYDFACAIVEGLRKRGIDLTVKQIAPVKTEEYPTAARRPHNSRLDLKRLKGVFGVAPMHWRNALEPELDILAAELA